MRLPFSLNNLAGKRPSLFENRGQERGSGMTRQELLKKLDSIAEEFERTNSWGSLEVEFKDGEANYVRRTFSESVREDAHAKTRAKTYR
jgi:hypothetical protein